MKPDKPYFIAETAFHHEGDVVFLKQLINASAANGFSAIKFHLLIDLDNYFIQAHQAYNDLKKWLISKEDWKHVIAYAHSKKLDVILLCNDPAAMDLAIELNSMVKAVELHATGLNDYFLLEKSIHFKGTVILGVGGSTLDEIQESILFLKNGKQSDIFLMYGFQNYPTQYEDINFSKMVKLAEMFELPVGYADHTEPRNEFNEIISTLPIMHGILVLEKHFTIEEDSKRIDHQSAILPHQFKRLKDLAEMMFIANGTGSLDMSASEKKYGNTGPMKKAIVAAKDIAAGETVELHHLTFKRTNSSSPLKQTQFLSLIGLKASRDIKRDDIIDFSNVAYEFKTADFSQFKLKK